MGDSKTLDKVDGTLLCNISFLPMNYNTVIDSSVYVINIVTCILNSVFAIPAVVGNAIVIAAISKTPSLRTPSNILLCSVALSDLLTGLINQPGYVFMKIAALKARWHLVCIGRVLYVVFGFALGGNSFLFLTAISVDKWLALHLHLRYKELVTTKKVLTWLIFSWLISLTSVWLFLARGRSFLFAVFVIIYGVCLFIINLFAYFNIFRIVKRHENQIQVQQPAHLYSTNQTNTLDVKRLSKLSKTFLMVFSIYFVCFLPNVGVMTVYATSGFTTSVKISLNLTSTLCFLNASLNPVIYYWKMKEIRQAVKVIMKVT